MLTKIEKKTIIVCIIVLALVFIITAVYNANYYKIDVETLTEKSVMYYKNLETNNSYATIDFMKYVSDQEYNKAFELLDVSNRANMFNNDVMKFKNKLYDFVDSYSKLQYNTIFSKEFENYIDEEIICMICDSNGEKLHGIRFNIRTYKTDKAPKIIILNID